mgnify:CR=1 FL=1
MNILVGISGGVDSAVAAHILKSQGHNIFGAMMKIYSGEYKNTLANSCYGTDKTREINDAINNCKSIGCDFNLIDVSSEFNEFVFEKFKREYLNARTPNPCVLCNPLIKFGVFPNKARDMGINFDKFATGHYIRNEYDEKIGKYILKRGIDPKKDQSYFLYALKQETLKNVLFPLGDMTKADVRNYALLNNIPVANKQDSQDFYSGSYADLLSVSESKGDIVDKYGNVLGQHNGVHNYTIGQRKGLLIAYSEPLYVIGFDTKLNQVIVSTKDDTYNKGLVATNLTWTFWDKPENKFTAKAKIRSAQQPFDCEVEILDDTSARVVFDLPQSSVAPGQAVVFYDDDIVLGGGTIDCSL